MLMQINRLFAFNFLLFDKALVLRCGNDISFICRVKQGFRRAQLQACTIVPGHAITVSSIHDLSSNLFKTKSSGE